VLAAAGLSFLGLGARPPQPEWASMLSGARDDFNRAPWLMVIPGVAITLTVLGFNLLGDAIRTALDPRDAPAMDVMQPEDRTDGWITFREGVRLPPGPANAAGIGADGAVETMIVENPKFLAGRWRLGIGYETRVMRGAKPVAVVLYVKAGVLRTIDSQTSLSVPIRSR